MDTLEKDRVGHISFLASKSRRNKQQNGTGWILPLVMGVGDPLHPLDLSEFSNLIASRQKNHTHIGGDGGGVRNPGMAVSMNASGGIGKKARLGKGQQIQARDTSQGQSGDREGLHAFPQEFPSHFNMIRLYTGTPKHLFDLSEGAYSHPGIQLIGFLSIGLAKKFI